MTDPLIRTVGLSGILVTFADAMNEPANRAALAFRAAVEAADWPEVRETSTSLVSTFLDVDLAATPIEAITERIKALLSSQDWPKAPLPAGRTLWHIPTVYGTDLAPQLEEAAQVAGVDPDAAIKELSTSRVRVLTIGFAPGQPYLGELSETWNIPRQEGLTKSVPPRRAGHCHPAADHLHQRLPHRLAAYRPDRFCELPPRHRGTFRLVTGGRADVSRHHPRRTRRNPR